MGLKASFIRAKKQFILLVAVHGFEVHMFQVSGFGFKVQERTQLQLRAVYMQRTLRSKKSHYAYGKSVFLVFLSSDT